MRWEMCPVFKRIESFAQMTVLQNYGFCCISLLFFAVSAAILIVMGLSHSLLSKSLSRVCLELPGHIPHNTTHTFLLLIVMCYTMSLTLAAHIICVNA